MFSQLDPLKAIACGRLVDAAYDMFETPGNEPLEPQLPGSLSGEFDLTAWIHMSDFAIFREKILKFYGFIAREKTEPASLFLVLRGTRGLWEWYDGMLCSGVPFQPEPSAGPVHLGFSRIYQTMKIIPTTSSSRPLKRYRQDARPASFAQQIEDHVASMSSSGTEKPQSKLTVTGHSLGAALATLYVMEHCTKKGKSALTVDTLCTFASPRVGMDAFKARFDALPIASWRIVNLPDIVPKTPVELLGYRHMDLGYEFSSAGIAKGNPHCWHSMKTYLHWLDPKTQALDGDCQK
jgi:hypothetical protein